MKNFFVTVLTMWVLIQLLVIGFAQQGYVNDCFYTGNPYGNEATSTRQTYTIPQVFWLFPLMSFVPSQEYKLCESIHTLKK